MRLIKFNWRIKKGDLQLVSKKARKKRGPRLIPDTLYEAINTVAKKLQEAEADPSAIEYLCNGIFPGGEITLEASKDRSQCKSLHGSKPRKEL